MKKLEAVAEAARAILDRSKNWQRGNSKYYKRLRDALAILDASDSP